MGIETLRSERKFNEIKRKLSCKGALITQHSSTATPPRTRRHQDHGSCVLQCKSKTQSPRTGGDKDVFSTSLGGFSLLDTCANRFQFATGLGQGRGASRSAPARLKTASHQRKSHDALMVHGGRVAKSCALRRHSRESWGKQHSV